MNHCQYAKQDKDKNLFIGFWHVLLFDKDQMFLTRLNETREKKFFLDSILN